MLVKTIAGTWAAEQAGFRGCSTSASLLVACACRGTALCSLRLFIEASCTACTSFWDRVNQHQHFFCGTLVFKYNVGPQTVLFHLSWYGTLQPAAMKSSAAAGDMSGSLS